MCIQSNQFAKCLFSPDALPHLQCNVYEMLCWLFLLILNSHEKLWSSNDFFSIEDNITFYSPSDRVKKLNGILMDFFLLLC